MEKLFVAFCIIVMVLVLCFGLAKAEPIDLGITEMELPDAQAGCIISFKEEGVEATLTSKIIAKTWDWGTLSLNAGGAPAINEPIISLAYQLPKDIVEKWGVEVPYSKVLDIRVGGYLGFEMNEYQNDPDNDWKEAIDYGAIVVGASIKF